LKSSTYESKNICRRLTFFSHEIEKSFG